MQTVPEWVDDPCKGLCLFRWLWKYVSFPNTKNAAILILIVTNYFKFSAHQEIALIKQKRSVTGWQTKKLGTQAIIRYLLILHYVKRLLKP